MIIYKATNTVNGKIYIGQTVNTLEYRKAQHFRDCNRTNRPHVYFHNAIIKHGKDAFVFEIIDTANSIDELNEKESYWISFYRSNDKTIGYNLDSGGCNCFKSDSTKKKIGLSSIEKWKDPLIEQRMRAGLVKATKAWKSKPKAEVELICETCHNVFVLKPYEVKNRRFCSNACANVYKVKSGLMNKASMAAREANIQRQAIRKSEMYNRIVNWVEKNKSTVLNCPYNKISSELKPLFDLVYAEYGVKDARSLYACFGVKGKKELLHQLKIIATK